MARAVDPPRRAHPLSEWPQIDQDAWAAAIAEGDVFDGRGPAAHWAAATKKTNIQHYGRWLGYLSWTGLLDVAQEQEDRVLPELVGTYNQHLKAIVAPRTRLSMLVGLKVMMQAMAPERSWRWLQDVCNRVQRGTQPVTDKKSRMRPSQTIYAAGLNVLEVLPASSLDLNHAIAYRDALMMALLSVRPLRKGDFAGLTVGRQITRIDDRWLISVVASKTGQPIEFFVPDSLVPWLERYLREVRTLFPGAATSQNLWLGKDGPFVGSASIYLRITKLTERLFGVAINPHLFRDCAATSLALVSADAARAATPLLGHRYPSTTGRYYVHASQLEASRRINDTLAEVYASLEDTE